MKCVKLVTKEIISVKNHEADRLVHIKEGNYCPKHVWKAHKKNKIK